MCLLPRISQLVPWLIAHDSLRRIVPCARSKANMAHPTKSWGFWRNEKHLGKYEQNAGACPSAGLVWRHATGVGWG